MKKKSCTEKKCFSEDCIKRLSLYLRNLKDLEKANVKVISSDKITKFLNVNPAQFRKDLSYFGEFGKRGVGYDVKNLIIELENILGVDKKWDIVIVGVGHLGRALMGFEGFSKFNLKINYAFDCDKNKINKKIYGVKVKDVKFLKRTIKEKNIKVGIISTVPQVAQHIAETMVEGGIVGILNFTPVILNLPENVIVSNIDMACELESLIFFTYQKLKKLRN